MKYRMKSTFSIIALILSLIIVRPEIVLAQENGFSDLPAWNALPVYIQEHCSEGLSDSFVRWPKLTTDDAGLLPVVERINQTIQNEAHIPAYLQLLSTVSDGSIGLKMGYEIGALSYHSANMPQGQYQLGNPYLSILFSVEGKMLQGRPSQVYYPMTFDLRTGERIDFDTLFTDPEAAKLLIEKRLIEEVEPDLSSYIENAQLLPVPFDRFFLDGFGHLIIVYEQSQFSFLSGSSGAVSFRYSELIPELDFSSEELKGYFDAFLTASVENRLINLKQMLRCSPVAARRVIQPGDALESVLAQFRSTTDSGYYPGGTYYEVEDANYRGALILTDESETIVTGVLTSRTDLMDIQTGKTLLSEAEAFLGTEPVLRIEIEGGLAELYHVCPGIASIFEFPDTDFRFTLYSDQAGVVQYVKLELK